MGMRPAVRTFLFLVLAAVTWGVSPAVAGTVPTYPSGAVGGLAGVAARALSRLPESGALLLWGTGLAAASRAVARKQ